MSKGKRLFFGTMAVLCGALLCAGIVNSLISMLEGK